MIVGFRDCLKLIGVMIVCACAVFVCTFMLNFYLDARMIESAITEQTRPLYDAQISMSKFTSCISGLVLAAMAVVLLFFYIKLYIDSNGRKLGILKALGYSRWRLAFQFCIFSLSVCLGCAIGFGAGYCYIPAFYRGMAIEPLEISIHFHPVLLCLIFVPTAVYAVFACLYAYFALKRPTFEMLRGEQKTKISQKQGKDREHSFLFTVCTSVLTSKKALVFFVAFACFCYSSMVQMGLVMKDYTKSDMMGFTITLIGFTLAATAMFIAITSLVNANKKNLAVMKAFGYTLWECALALFAGFVPFAVLGFALGTVYQHFLLWIMINIVFKNVGEMVSYSFDVTAFLITFITFLILYAAVLGAYTLRLKKVRVKEIMEEK